MPTTTLSRPETRLERARDPFGWLFDRDLRWMRQMTRDLDRLFGNFGVRVPSEEVYGPDMAWIPELEVFERNGKFMVRADLPGLKKEDVKVSLQEDRLIIEGERKVEEDVKKYGFHRTERSYGAFFRSLTLPEGVKADKIDAAFKDGVLEIAIPMEPKKEQARRNVEVKIA